MQQSSSPSVTGSSKLESLADEGVAGTTKTFPYTEKWRDIYEWAERSTLGEQHTYCLICSRSLSTFHKGLIELKRHVTTNKHRKRANSHTHHRTAEPLPVSDAAVRFIHRHCGPDSAEGQRASEHVVRRKLGPQYPEAFRSVCQHTPYCVYIYGGVTVEQDDAVSVFLVGFFDVESSRYCIRFLDAIQSVGAGDQAVTVAETLNKFGLPTDNLVAVYCDGDGVEARKVCSQLRELNPHIVSLGALYTMADTACQTAVNQLSNLMADIHSHFSSCPVNNDDLGALFGAGITVNRPSFHLSTSCLQFGLLVTKILEMWTDLVLHFSSCDKDDDKAKLICSQLQDPKVRATFMFLEQALKPLQSFQRRLQPQTETRRAHMLLILEEASNLLSTYTSCFLRPQAAVRFLKEPDAQILKNKKSHLSRAELSLGGKAVEDFLAEAEASEELPQVVEQVMSFYIALTGSIAEELPLSDGTLRSIAQLLNPQSSRAVTAEAVGELGAKLGICSSPEEATRLTSEFLEYQLAEEGEKDSAAVVSLESHWAGVLKDSKHTSAFRRLVLTLLSLPCPPLDAQQVVSQVCRWEQYQRWSTCVSLLLLYFLFQALEKGNSDSDSSSSSSGSPRRSKGKKLKSPLGKMNTRRWIIRCLTQCLG